MTQRDRWTFFWVSLYVLLALVVVCGTALAQQNAPKNCSQSAGPVAALVPFPAAGASGPTAPLNYLQICNAHATNTLGINVTGGTAAIGSAGTLTLSPGGCRWWTLGSGSLPAKVSVIGSGDPTPTACDYR
jgi:hypothetical protein